MNYDEDEMVEVIKHTLVHFDGSLRTIMITTFVKLFFGKQYSKIKNNEKCKDLIE